MSVDTYPTSVLNAQLWNGQSMPLSIAGGGTGATTAALARTNLGLGTMAEQNANAVAITGGDVEAARVGVNVDVSGDALGTLRVGAAAILGSTLAVSGTATLSGACGIQTGATATRALILHWSKAGQCGLEMRPNDTDSGNPAVLFLNVAAATVGTITTTGSATAYNTASDVRLKHAVATLTGALDRVRALRPISHRWNADDSYGEGFLAHELMQHVPLAVTGEPDALNEDGTIRPQQADYSKLVPWLVGAIQELSTRLERLEEAFA